MLRALAMTSDHVALPDGWTEALDVMRSRPYYINSVSGHLQWERPQYAAHELPCTPDESCAAKGEPTTPDESCAAKGEPVADAQEDGSVEGQPVVATSSVVAVSDPANGTDAEGNSSGLNAAIATHIRPWQERKAGKLYVGLGFPDLPAPGAKAKSHGERWCIIEDGEFFVLPHAESPASDVLLKLGLVGCRGVTCPSELTAGCQHGLFLDLSPEPRSREGWQGMGRCTQLVLVAGSAEEQLEWQTTLQRVATACRNWRRLGESPGVVMGGLKSVGASVGNFALHAAGSGLGWQVGRDAGATVSRAVGLRR